MSVAENLQTVLKPLPSTVKLVAISKFHPDSDILDAYQAGQRIFGESRVQELIQKQAALPKDIEWHLIGHLQSNKIKTVLPLVSLIQSVDSVHLIEEIEHEAAKQNRNIDCLLQVHIAKEPTKYGFTFDEVRQFLQSDAFRSLNHLHVVGLMGMATYTEDVEVIRGEFRSLKALFNELKSLYFQHVNAFRTLSMGMSNDYLIAIEEGGTMVRIGTAVFGLRPCALP
jgi:pyridoxal phosphate enzyme (YggS family)